MLFRRAGRALQDQRGQMLVIAAIMMPAVIAMAGLVLDGGFIYAEVRRAQAAADASALAGATYVWKNTTANCSTSDTCGAKSYAGAMGYTSSNSTVTVAHPAETTGTYSSVEYATIGDYVKVTVEYDAPKFFIGIIFPAVTQISANAIAGIARVPYEYALVSLGDTCTDVSGNADGGLIVSGAGKLTVNNGAMFSNCTQDPAINVTGSGKINGDAIQTAGTCLPDPLPQVNGVSPPCEEGVAQIPDPLEGSLPWPCSSSTTGNSGASPFCAFRGSVSGNVGDTVLNPGVYDEINPSGSSKLWLRSGVYIIRSSATDDGLSFAGSTGINDCGAPTPPAGGAPPGNTGLVSDGFGCGGDTGGVLLVNATNEYDGERAISGSATKCDDGNTPPAPQNSTITFTGNGGFSLHAKTTGPYAGLVLWQACDISSIITLTGNASSEISGTVYAPDALVKLSGSAFWDTPSSIISKYTELAGSADLTVDYNRNVAYKPWAVVLIQ